MLGIGGIGLSALALALKHDGKNVSGQDTELSLVTEKLGKEGISVMKGQKRSAIPKETDLVIYSRALAKREPDFLKKLEADGVATCSYPEALGFYSEGKYTIAIAGTHGKTTTTAMVTHVLSSLGVSPTAIVGSILKGVDSNFIAGTSDYFIVEADEYRRAFLELSPRIVAITNIGSDHLDYFKDVGDILSAFKELVSSVPRNGFIIANRSLPLVREALSEAQANIIDYMDFYNPELKLPFPGVHNRENAAIALAVANVLGLDVERATSALLEFPGTWRRFDLKGETPRGAVVYDDYAHNPDKVRAAISGFREAHPDRRLTVVFQPHLYSRTKTLMKGFMEAFDGADEVIFVPIFAAREKKDLEVSSRVLMEKTKVRAREKNLPLTVSYSANQAKLSDKLLTTCGARDVIVVMGAGDIYKLGDALVAKRQ